VAEAKIVARCVVCRGDIFGGDEFEEWEGGFYCRRHSLPYLRERARQYRDLIESRLPTDKPEVVEG